jgi:two-component system sensor histidine kinase KdpD
MSSFELTDATSWEGLPVARRVIDARPRARVVATGTVVATEVTSRGSSPVFCCTLQDGSGELDVLFLGRSSVPGFSVGTRCSVEGLALYEANRLAVWNPRYRFETTVPDAEPSGANSPFTEESAPTDEPASESAWSVPSPAREIDGDVEVAGHFRVYLGAVAGVGKTMAMLDEAHRRLQRGADVVIGVVESHSRPLTEERTIGLEVVPRRAVDYRGVVLSEMDLEAVIARHPDVVLVDELAHTNAPGSGRNEKRWQDVLEILQAGIDVIATVNIQHLESMADTVERITEVPVRERVPDWVVRRADQIELIDSSPEQLRRRMLHGNIYAPERVSNALAHFFRTENLTALREMALRFLADETDEDLLEYLGHSHPEVVWETAERIMVAVNTAPGTDGILRRAARMATRIKADLHVVYVNGQGNSHPVDSASLEQLRRLTVDVGASWHQLDRDDTVAALIEFALHKQITQIVIGSSQRNRRQEILGGGSIVRRLTRAATAERVDVHIIARRENPVAAGTTSPAKRVQKG